MSNLLNPNFPGEGGSSHSLLCLINECHFFADYHYIFNYSMTILIWIVHFGSITFMSMANYFYSFETRAAYAMSLFFTGSPTNPSTTNKNEIVLFVWFYFIFLLLIFLIFTILLYMVLRNTLTFRFLKNILYIFTLYIIPLLIPFFGKTFMASVTYLNMKDDPYPFLASVCGELCIIFYSCLVAMKNSSSCYKIPHIFFQADTFSAIVVNFFNLFMQHSVSYIERPQFVFFVVVIIFFVAYGLYLFIQLPYSTRSMNVIGFLYTVYCAGGAVLRAYPQLESLRNLFIIALGSILITFILFVIRYIFERTKGKIYMLLCGCRVNASNEILKEDLTKYPYQKIMLLGRSIKLLDEDAVHKIINEIERRELTKFEQSIYLYTLKSILIRKSGGVMSAIQNQVDKVSRKIDEKEREFWRCIWSSDFENIPKMSAKIGRLKQTLYSYVNHQKVLNPGIQLDEKYQPLQLSVCSPLPSNFILIIIIFGVALYFHSAIFSAYMFSISNQEQFFDFRRFMANFTMMQTEVWNPNGTSLSIYYEATNQMYEQFSLNKIKFFSISEVFSTTINQTTFEDIYNDYMDLVLRANNTENDDQIIDRLSSHMIFLAFENTLNNPIRFFDSHFPDRINIHKYVWFFLIILCCILIVLIFFITVIYKSHQLHKMYAMFSTFSKSLIAEYSKINTKQKDNIIPRKQTIIEWPALRAYLFGFVLTMIFLAIVFGIGSIVSNDTFGDYNSRSTNFVFFNKIDLMMLWLCDQVFMNSTQDENNYLPMQYCDAHMDYLMRQEEAQTYVNTLSEDLINLISYYAMGIPNSFPIYPVSQILSVFDGLNEVEIPLKNLTDVFYIRWFIFLFLLIFIFMIVFVLQIIGILALRAIISERNNLILRFIKETNSTLGDFKKSNYKLTELPILYVEVNNKDNISFLTKTAKTQLSLSEGQTFSVAKFGVSASAEITKIINKIKEGPTSDSTCVNLDDGSSLLIIPTYGGHTLTKLTSYSFFKLPQELTPSEFDEDSGKNKFYNYFPVVVSSQQPFPQVVQIISVPFLVLMVRLSGMNEWSEKTDPKIVEQYYKMFVKESDQICAEDNKFMRVFIRDDYVLFMSNPEIQMQGRWTFITNCAEFGRKIKDIVHVISDKFSTNIFASIIFARGEKQMMYVADSPCTQADFLPDTLSLDYIKEALRMFNIEGVGFVVMHRPNLRIPNTSLISMYLSFNGVPTDLFLVT